MGSCTVLRTARSLIITQTQCKSVAAIAALATAMPAPVVVPSGKWSVKTATEQWTADGKQWREIASDAQIEWINKLITLKLQHFEKVEFVVDLKVERYGNLRHNIVGKGDVQTFCRRLCVITVIVSIVGRT